MIIGVVLFSLRSIAADFNCETCRAVENQAGSEFASTVSEQVLWNPEHPLSNVDLVYHVDHRYMTTVTKEVLHNAKSIVDILPEKAIKSVETYQNARVSILHDELETTEKGNGDLLNDAQKKLLLTTDYSSNIRITSILQKRNDAGNLEKDSLVYYLTVIPEQEATYAGGRQALIEYLRENSREAVSIIKEDERQASRVNFTITKEGTITGVKLTGTTGYSSVDKALVELIMHMPEKWIPATNSKGEKVDQELVFFFGLQGC